MHSTPVLEPGSAQTMTPCRPLVRAGMAALALFQALLGGWALLLPRAFFDDFPLPGHAWVAELAPYNEHLIRDYGGLNLGFCFIFAACAIGGDRRTTRTALAGFELFTVPHFIFHATHLDGFTTTDAISQTGSLGLVAVLPLVLIALTRRQG